MGGPGRTVSARVDSVLWMADAALVAEIMATIRELEAEAETLLNAARQQSPAPALPPSWLVSVERYLAEAVQRAAKSEDALAAIEDAARGIPALLKSMDVDALAEFFESGMAEALLQAVSKGTAEPVRNARGPSAVVILNAVPVLQEAVEKLAAKSPVGSTLRTKDWERVPLALRERAQFSAGVESARLLQDIQDRLLAEVKQEREQLADGKTATFSRDDFINRIRERARELGVDTVQDESERGGIKDITSIPRLGLIHDLQMAQASGFATYKLDQTEGALLLYPAQRLSASTAANPRKDWFSRWQEAGRAVGWQGALPTDFVALKTSPIWAALSRFGTPWPPFDFGSTRELEDVDWDTALELGLVKPEEPPQPVVAEFNEGMEASAAGLDERTKAELKELLGDKIAFDGDAVRWAA